MMNLLNRLDRADAEKKLGFKPMLADNESVDLEAAKLAEDAVYECCEFILPADHVRFSSNCFETMHDVKHYLKALNLLPRYSARIFNSQSEYEDHVPMGDQPH